ncbi:MAG TPA: CRTAC1 family protein [Bryobacteraceae bacterium]|nr:CRTAC1 family protein [Bryobacteraceae bacterium]
MEVLNRRSFLLGASAPAFGADGSLRLAEVTRAAGIAFSHDRRASGRKHLPETLGPGCLFFDYDGDGWQDIAIANGSGIVLYRNNRDGTFHDVTRQAGLTQPMYALGLAAGDFDNDGNVDLYVTCVGQNRLFRNTGKGSFVDVTKASGLALRQGFSTSAAWLDYDRDGLLDLFVCNYVKWSPEIDIFCSSDGKSKTYCTPEAYRGTTCWLFRNRGGGRFEDVTAKAGIFDSTSKSLGVSVLDIDGDGWPDLFVANDTQPNKLYRNLRNGTFEEIGVKAGVAFSEDGKARAGMGADAAELDGSGLPSIAVTNFQNEMLGFYQPVARGAFADRATKTEIGPATRKTLGFGCFFFDPNLDGALDLLVANGHLDSGRNITHAQSPHLFLQSGGRFQDVAAQVGGAFAGPKIGRGAAYGDFDNDGDQDILITTNGGAPALYRVDAPAGHRSIRLRMVGTASNRDAIGARVQLQCGDLRIVRTVKIGGSYLSQSELPLTFGIGRRDAAAAVVVHWPSGKVEEHRGLRAGSYVCTEGKGLVRH